MRTAAIRRLGVLTCVLAALAVALSLLPSAASASPFCGGQVVNSGHTCFGAARAMSGANAYGQSTSVCVGVNGVHTNCSPGPNQFAIANVAYGVYNPSVRGNAASNTVVWGNTF